ncbi:hypothetical protein GLOTRDRAFT_90333 [Gloeophyllum trabeum ATCC 11539]|uniref:Uncharacterized protein n=1 Tax=Gloeophyllum trabeum (strain ATCC 11539 / FP-39264 / Madison 617) TaxID=670483 RepID=S7QND3_GLOTA|nr:uncharacterized protein GLOTRDRAFT_90333 [Gloeophyllum trabeum ATCC 11539]EPQ61026.1 hypothetical protein GLOTRDRAFT_90333 [Gloeophyllum trabeum ATCC 11539]
MVAHGWILTSLIFFLLFYPRGSLAALVNVTVDDTNGDLVTGVPVVYSPPQAWNIGQNCTGCTAKPDPAQVYMGTWHDATFVPTTSDSASEGIISLTVPFNGGAVYVYCILTFTFDHPAGNSDMLFWIDNDIVGTFELPANGSTVYDYHFPVYVNESIEAGPHTFRLETGHNNTKSTLLFDSLVYTHDDTSMGNSTSGGGSRHNSSHVHGSPRPGQQLENAKHSLSKKFTIIIAVVSSLLGTVIVIGTVILFIILRRRRRQRSQQLSSPSTESSDSPTALLGKEGPGERWIARHSQDKALPPIVTDTHSLQSGSASAPHSTARAEQQPPWLSRDPYPSSNVGHSTVSPVSPATTTSSSGIVYALQPPTRNSSVRTRRLPSPWESQSATGRTPIVPSPADTLYFPPTFPYALATGDSDIRSTELTRSSTQATYGTIASSIAPYSDPVARDPREDSELMSPVTDRSEPTSAAARSIREPLPPSYHDSQRHSEKRRRP